MKLPTLTGKHKKSTVCEHPSIEFLEMQITALKTSLSSKELELTKLKQSDSLKAKQIMNLEVKLQDSLTALSNNSNVIKEINSNVENAEQETVKNMLLLNICHYLFGRHIHDTFLGN